MPANEGRVEYRMSTGRCVRVPSTNDGTGNHHDPAALADVGTFWFGMFIIQSHNTRDLKLQRHNNGTLTIQQKRERLLF